MTNTNFLIRVRTAAEKKLLFFPHTVRQMSCPDRMISTAEVESVIFGGDIIEDYPEDIRGHSCLMLGLIIGNRPIHVVCSPKEGYLAIITTYIPTALQWTPDFKERL